MDMSVLSVRYGHVCSVCLLWTCLFCLSVGIQRDALTIYKQYISMQAKTPINIPIEIRHEIELGICQDDGFVSPYVFLEAQKTVFNLLLQQ